MSKPHGWTMTLALLLSACTAGGHGDDDDDDDDGSSSCDERVDDCPGETLCLAGACEPAFGRRYRLSDLAVSIPDRKPDGEPWDSLGGAPDPFVEVWRNDDDLILRTAVVDDVFDASFPETGDATFDAGDAVFIDVLDEDIAEHDGVFTCYADPLPAAALRERAVRCASEGYTVELSVELR